MECSSSPDCLPCTAAGHDDSSVLMRSGPSTCCRLWMPDNKLSTLKEHTEEPNVGTTNNPCSLTTWWALFLSFLLHKHQEKSPSPAVPVSGNSTHLLDWKDKQ